MLVVLHVIPLVLAQVVLLENICQLEVVSIVLIHVLPVLELQFGVHPVLPLPTGFQLLIVLV